MNRKEIYREISRKKSFLCVGLDSDIQKLPSAVRNDSDPVFRFNKEIVDATHQYAVAYKPNLAFYEALGPKGLVSLEKTVDYIRSEYTYIDGIASMGSGKFAAVTLRGETDKKIGPYNFNFICLLYVTFQDSEGSQKIQNAIPN